MTNDKKYDLEERTARFGQLVIDLCRNLSKTDTPSSLIDQLVRSSTSIGANYMEADGAESKRDFRHKIGICKKESKETMHWLRMVARAHPAFSDKSRKLWQEAHELTLIFSAILKPKN